MRAGTHGPEQRCKGVVDLDHETTRSAAQGGTLEPLTGRREACVAILLSAFNGERFLGQQLHSYVAQTHQNWQLYWRDDGSSDGSAEVMNGFAAERGSGQCVHLDDAGHHSAANSFLSLLRMALLGEAVYFAFSDQDDVWLPDKLAHAVARLAQLGEGRPGLYFCPRALVDADLRPIGPAPRLRRPPGFPAALTQNVIPGCCLMLNRAAAELIEATEMPDRTWHDWWCYLVVSANDGAILRGETPDILYRQHAGNLVGEPSAIWRRAIRAANRGREPFMSVFWRHVAALRARPELLPERSRAILTTISDASRAGIHARARALFIPGFVRQTWLETLIFRLWFLLG